MNKYKFHSRKLVAWLSMASIVTSLMVVVVPVANAAGPVGTMAMTTQSVATLSTGQALNTITITSNLTEITAATDIFIRIPDSVNARFDTTDTTVGIVQSSTGMTSTTVSYPVSNKTVKLDVTVNFDSGENVEISGLTILADAVTASTALVWAVDDTTEGSATFSATSGAELAVTATDAAGSLTLTNAAAGSNGTATLTLTVSVDMAINDTITFTAPAELDVSNLSTTTVTGTIDGTTGIMTCTAASQVVTCTLTTVGDHAAGADKTIIFPASSIRGGYVAAIGNIADLAINDVSATPAGADINSDSTVATPAITVGDLTSTNFTPESLSLSTISPTTITFVTSALIPASGKIVAVFPTGWNLDGASGQVASSLSGLSGSWTAGISGQTLTLSGGTSTGVGTKSLTIGGIMTPPNEGSGGAYSLTTTTSGDVNIETDAAVTADTIIGKSTGSVNPVAPTGLAASVTAENAIKLTWTDATSTGSVKVYRGIAPSLIDGGVALALVDAGIGEYTDTDVQAGDVVSYVLKTVSGGGGMSSSSETVTITVTAGATSEVTAPAEEPVPPTTEPTPDTTPPPVALTYDQEQQQVKDLGIVTTDFDKATNKCEAIVMLARAAGWEIDSTVTEDGFVDTPMWCKPYAAKAKELGVVNGRTATELGVDGEVNRYEIGVMLARVLGATEADMTAAAALTIYDDEIVDWAKGAVNWLHAEGVMTGYPDNTYKGANSILKIELAVALGRAFDLLVAQ